MSARVGGGLHNKNLLFAMDAQNPKSNYELKQGSNLLPNPHYWTAGTGGVTGYNQNGTAAEQNRDVRTDPFGGTTMTWQSVPDAFNDADGGWDSVAYPVDTTYTYRWSVWVKKYSPIDGGRAYLGLNPTPIRNDTGNPIPNPYFAFPLIDQLTLNQWYLIVGHCFYEGYTGGRHPNSGWYANGQKIPDIHYGNIGTEDVRWTPGTTTAVHRAYHYYSTVTGSGIEFAYPRLDKCDGTEPTMRELLNMGQGKIYNLASNNYLGSAQSGFPVTASVGGKTAISFTVPGQGFDDTTGLTSPVNNGTLTLEAWIYPEATELTVGDRGTVVRIHTGQGAYLSWNKTTQKVSSYWYGTSIEGYHELGPALARQQWHHIVAVWTGTQHYHYINGVQYGPIAITGTPSTAQLAEIGMESTARQFHGGIGMVRVYNEGLTAAQVKSNYLATKPRFG